MSDLRLTKVPLATTGMLIRKPATEVYEAFVDPGITAAFWFTRGSGRLQQGKTVQWEWQMYDFSLPVTARSVEPDRRLVVQWPGHGTPTTIEWTFDQQLDGTTFVTITEQGFIGTGDELVAHVRDSTEGFALVLAGAKAFLEHGIRLNLVADRFPKGLAAA
ncbi:MAG TPA: SRPBCC family protein [Candidatus Binatia bacterium]|nr:SRPBCC family protein [Candidatus Binatia bacterium]